MDRHVVGFALDEANRVCLIWKTHPAWQAGLLNGVGGHIEEGESPEEAMRREFQEETGLDLPAWELMVMMTFPGAQLYIYRARVSAEVLSGVTTMTEETVSIMPLDTAIWYALNHGAIPNLAWLLPLAAYTADTYDPIRVKASVAGVI